jgi:hypothetical protein
MGWFRAIFSHARWRWAALCTVLLGICVVLFYYIAQFIVALMIFGAIVGDNSNIMTDSVENRRGDKAEISTKVFDQFTPDRTVIRLWRTHHWFWTTIFIVDSIGIQEDLNWKNNNILNVNLNFGFNCPVQFIHLTNVVGSIRIFYNFTYNDRKLGSCPKNSARR